MGAERQGYDTFSWRGGCNSIINDHDRDDAAIMDKSIDVDWIKATIFLLVMPSFSAWWDGWAQHPHSLSTIHTYLTVKRAC